MNIVAFQPNRQKLHQEAVILSKPSFGRSNRSEILEGLNMLKLASWKFFAVMAILCLAAMSLFFAGQILINHCLWWECAPRRAFTVFDLELPVQYFPSGADMHTLKPLRGDLASVEAAATADYWDKGSAIFVVRRFATESQAVQDYDYDSAFRFTLPMESASEYSVLVNHKSSLANQSQTACGYVLDDFRCIYVARYAEFTVFFNGSMGDGEMTQDNFIGVMKYLDERMQELLKP
jgi:hypothetical protein